MHAVYIRDSRVEGEGGSQVTIDEGGGTMLALTHVRKGAQGIPSIPKLEVVPAISY